MNYYGAHAGVQRSYWRDDGYTGNRALVGLAYDPESQHAIEVANCGCYRANDRTYEDESEMLYYFDNHRSVHFRNVISEVVPIDTLTEGVGRKR
jgi:hypothetical protein